ncbi:ABC transporter ATP-binding protein [Rhizobium paranaense]|uniref:Peptide/nickel transport system ATP-binding protein n=1 Tax=Rhizobium paranaense TaxID=1650438 RepID=A0A7W8XTY0_9HYPH|nr:ABC transporter ATP-binding protein [Rhizobium paranaense]MBB5575491.1 peptide/nickel transport system ATP-binding protein [Rhizobium paranaense]
MNLSSNLVEVRGLQVDFLTHNGLFTAVKGVDFDIRRGEVMGLAGESGCGKSTIAFALMRLHRPPAIISRGDIRIDGTDVLALSARALEQWRWRKASMVFQSAMSSLNPVLTIFEQFRDVLSRHDRMGRDAARARAETLMQLVSIPSDRLDDYPHQLSGGMRQRVVLAIALALEPQLVIMDEPTTALDVVVQREILQEIVTLKEKLNFSILFITHDLALMAQFADRIAIMLKGEIVETAPVADIVAAPRHDYTRRLWDAMPRLGHAMEAVV